MITVIGCGPQRVVEALRTALALGADNAILIEDPALKGADYLQLTNALAAAAKQINPDIILTGSRSVDYDQGQRGIFLAGNGNFSSCAHFVCNQNFNESRASRSHEKQRSGGILLRVSLAPRN